MSKHNGTRKIRKVKRLRRAKKVTRKVKKVTNVKKLKKVKKVTRKMKVRRNRTKKMKGGFGAAAEEEALMAEQRAAAAARSRQATSRAHTTVPRRQPIRENVPPRGLTEHHQVERNNLATKHDTANKRLATKHTGEKDSLQAKHATDVEAKAKAHAEELRKATAEGKSPEELQAIKDKHAAENKKMTEDHAAAQKKLSDAHENAIKNLQDAHQKQIDTMIKNQHNEIVGKKSMGESAFSGIGQAAAMIPGMLGSSPGSFVSPGSTVIANGGPGSLPSDTQYGPNGPNGPGAPGAPGAPGSQNLGPNGELLDVYGNPILGPNGELLGPDGQPLLGQNGELLGPDGQPLLDANGNPMYPDANAANGTNGATSSTLAALGSINSPLLKGDIVPGKLIEIEPKDYQSKETKSFDYKISNRDSKTGLLKTQFLVKLPDNTYKFYTLYGTSTNEIATNIKEFKQYMYEKYSAQGAFTESIKSNIKNINDELASVTVDIDELENKVSDAPPNLQELDAQYIILLRKIQDSLNEELATYSSNEADIQSGGQQGGQQQVPVEIPPTEYTGSLDRPFEYTIDDKPDTSGLLKTQFMVKIPDGYKFFKLLGNSPNEIINTIKNFEEYIEVTYSPQTKFVESIDLRIQDIEKKIEALEVSLNELEPQMKDIPDTIGEAASQSILIKKQRVSSLKQYVKDLLKIKENGLK